MNEPIDKIIAYENGELDWDEVLVLFAELIKNGMAWILQGHYGRTATILLDLGHIDREGNLL